MIQHSVNTPLSMEALVLCERLSKAYHADYRKRNILGRPSGDEAYQRKNRRVWRKACDRWRRRAGFEVDVLVVGMKAVEEDDDIYE